MGCSLAAQGVRNLIGVYGRLAKKSYIALVAKHGQPWFVLLYAGSLCEHQTVGTVQPSYCTQPLLTAVVPLMQAGAFVYGLDVVPQVFAVLNSATVAEPSLPRTFHLALDVHDR